MEYDEDKVDEMILALLHLTTFKDGIRPELEEFSPRSKPSTGFLAK